jgi:toxin YoeB
MAFKIIWTAKAQHDRIQILQYWIDRNKSTLFAIKLNEIFNERVELLARYPNLGKQTDFKHIKAHIVRDYLIFYKITDKTIIVVSIFDNHLPL